MALNRGYHEFYLEVFYHSYNYTIPLHMSPVTVAYWLISKEKTCFYLSEQIRAYTYPCLKTVFFP
jgi:hypothetical protein